MIKILTTLNLIFLFLILFSIVAGSQIGFFNEIFRYPVLNLSGQHNLYFPLKPVTFLIYSALGFALSLILIYREYFQKLSNNTKLTIAILILIPESVSIYEFLNQYAFWISENFVQDPYFILTTKLLGAIIFFLIGLQILLLKD